MLVHAGLFGIVEFVCRAKVVPSATLTDLGKDISGLFEIFLCAYWMYSYEAINDSERC